MSDLLSDFLNDKLQPVQLRGAVNGVLDYCVDELEDDDISDSEPDSDTEQQEYVRREVNSYHRSEKQEIGALSDIDDGHEESILGSDIMELLHVPAVFEKYKFDAYYKKELPIDSFRNKITEMINANPVVVIHGPTGCGKTTQVPQYLLDQCKQTKSPCNIVVTQPRRIAAINIAQRVCEERGWQLGKVCGYQVGLDKNVGEDVILTYMTTEVLLQKLILAKNLNRYTHVIVDEVHERNKTLDFLLLLVRKYLFTNSPGVRVVLMSATMESQEFAYYFRTMSRADPHQHLLAPVMHVNKRNEFQTSIYYNENFTKQKMAYNIDEPGISDQQYKECLMLLSFFNNIDDVENGERIIGSVLVFLPGFHEIEVMHKMLEEAHTNPNLQWEIIPLHSSLSSDQMVRVFQKPKPGCRKIILSTNLAESSVTVPDVKYVIDFCLTKIMTMNPSTKFSSLCLQWASHNNCIQRAGRVGRVANGRVYRLVPIDFYENHMQANTVPELQRAPLENIILYMKLLNLYDTPKNVLSLALSPPNLKDVETCIWHLKEVGALLPTCRGKRTSADGDITFLGKVMGSLPLDIHLSKLIILGHMFSCLEETVIMAAGCMTRNLFLQNFHDRFKCYKKKLLWADGSCSDFITLLTLYNVWFQRKREHAFRTTQDEYAWSKTLFVNLKGLREWDILIKEIMNRLKKFGIEKPMGVTCLRLEASEKPTILKIVICGAFYPNYFIRSSDFGQIDSREAVRTLNGRDPYNTVYFTNMKPNQPGQIYVRQIKKLLRADNNSNVKIGFDPQSTKIFVEFKHKKEPQRVEANGQEYITEISGKISADVYEAVRKRQLRISFLLQVLPDDKAWEFANSTEKRYELENSQPDEELNCYTAVNYSPLPSLDIEYVTVTVSHLIDCGHFYCQNWNDETRLLLDKIFRALNGHEVFLEPANEKIEVDKMYAARFDEDMKYYRCRIRQISPGKPPFAQVQFCDYGNIQKVPTNLLCELPPNCPDCKAEPVAMCCVLSEVQPDLIRNPKGLWSDRANNIFRRKTGQVLLNAKVYSVVDNVVHLELYLQNPGPDGMSFNDWLVNEGYGQKCQESHISKMDHEIRLKVLSSENPNYQSNLYSTTSTVRNYTDFDEPQADEATETVALRGPFSVLEMKVCGLIRASVGSVVHVDNESVNAVLLDDNPEDPNSRLLVAAQVAQSSVARNVKLSQTTLMPSIPALPLLVTLLFCPQMEPKLTPDGSRVASVLCGLGYNELTNKPYFPMHDVSLVVDTDLNEEIIVKINELRHDMNRGIKVMENIHEEISYSYELYEIQKDLKEHLFKLLHTRQKSVDRVHVRYADVWNKSEHENIEKLKPGTNDEESDIWRLHGFVKLDADKHKKMTIEKNLYELSQIAKRLAPEKEIVCEICKSDVLKTISDVRIHLFRDQHKTIFARYTRSQGQTGGED